MIAEYERAQIAERTRRGRVEKARHGEFMPWAYTCYGYRYLPKRHGCAPQVMIEPSEAEVVRAMYRVLGEEQVSCRQIPKRLNVANTPTPTGKNTVWQHATVRNILANRTYTGQARYNYRQPVLPQSRKKEEHQLRSLKTGRPRSWRRPLGLDDGPQQAVTRLREGLKLASDLAILSSHAYKGAGWPKEVAVGTVVQ
jgi:site-specific DNA recombinase